ncbi:MAG: LPS export ABC transporter periplasmic protein LptC [Deltaproteobacteria bacterium]|nr:LPS export ABC transporter periplasmic protein LptC [Deltaproteobacteria bacterium]
MWFKWLGALVIIILIGIIVIEKEDTVQQIQTMPILRSAQQIIMHEKKIDSDITTLIEASSITEQPDNMIHLDTFDLTQSDGLRIAGIEAVYNMNDSILTITGPVTIEMNNGRRANLEGLVWDRKSQKAFTPNPVVVTGIEGTIRANKAEFQNDFSLIHFSGGVHAQISQDILYN